MEQTHAQWVPATYDWNTLTLEAYDSRNTNKRRRPTGQINCQVPGCTVDLKDAKPYFKRHSICMTHMKAPYVLIHGVKMRYCQQCGHFEELELFGGANRSCKMSLERRSNIAASKVKRGGRSTKARDQQDMVTSDNTTDNGTNSRTWGATTTETEAEADRRSQPESQAHILMRDVDLAADSSRQDFMLAINPPAGRFNPADPNLSSTSALPSPPPPSTRADGDSPLPVAIPTDAGNSAILPWTSYEDGSVNLHLPHQPAPPPMPQLPPPTLPPATSRELPARLPAPSTVTGELPHTHSLGNGKAEAAASCGGGGGWGALGGGAGHDRGGGEVNSSLLYRNVHYTNINNQRCDASAKLAMAPSLQSQASTSSHLQQQPAPQFQLPQPQPRQQQLYCAAAGPAMGALAPTISGVDDVDLEMQLQDIASSAQLEQLGWFSSSSSMMGPEPAHAHGAAAGTDRVLAPLYDRGGCAAFAPHDAHHRHDGSGAYLPGGVPGAQSVRTAQAAFAQGAPSSSMEAALRYGMGGSMMNSVQHSNNHHSEVVTLAGRSCSSLMAAMQYMNQQNPMQHYQRQGQLTLQQQQQQRHHQAPQLSLPLPQQMVGGHGTGGGAGRMLGGLASGGSVRETLRYRAGEADSLVRMSIKLTSRAPDELDPGTVASLRKMLSVYDKLQSLQGYVRPGCTQLVIDARFALLPAISSSCSSLANCALSAADTSETHIPCVERCNTRSDSAFPSAGAAIPYSVSPSVTSSRGSSWWCDESSAGSLHGLPSAMDGAARAQQLRMVAGGKGLDLTVLLNDPLVREALKQLAMTNSTALTLQLEDTAISVYEDGSLGSVRQLQDLPTIVAASCAAVSTDNARAEVTLYGTHLDNPGTVFWARMHGVFYPLQSHPSRDGGVVVRLPALPACGVLHLEAATATTPLPSLSSHGASASAAGSASGVSGGADCGALGPSYPLLVLSSAEAVAEVHAVAASMGPVSLRRFVLDLGTLLATPVLLAQPLNGVVPVHGSTAMSTATAAGCFRDTCGAVPEGSDCDDEDGDVAPFPAAEVPRVLGSCGVAVSASASLHHRRRGGSRSNSGRVSSRMCTPGNSGNGNSGGGLSGWDITDGMTNADDEDVLETVLGAEAVRSLLGASAVLLETTVSWNMPRCTAAVIAALAELHERFPDRVHSGLAPLPRPGAFGLMHAVARAGDENTVLSVMNLEGALGEMCSLTLRGVDGVTPLHLLALLPHAPRLMLALLRVHPAAKHALTSAIADDGLTPLQLYQMMHPGGPTPAPPLPAAGAVAEGVSLGAGGNAAAAVAAMTQRGRPMVHLTPPQQRTSADSPASSSTNRLSRALDTQLASGPESGRSGRLMSASIPTDMLLAAAAGSSRGSPVDSLGGDWEVRAAMTLMDAPSGERLSAATTWSGSTHGWAAEAAAVEAEWQAYHAKGAARARLHANTLEVGGLAAAAMAADDTKKHHSVDEEEDAMW
ncbi:hypothetical protein Agub_g5476, partial [Astrephomene gubernaculifera]